MNRIFTGLLAATLVLACLAGTLARASEPVTYTFGVVPQFDARQTHRVWRPLLTALEERTGLKFRLRGSPNIPGFESQIMAGEFDFAYTNPYQILKTNTPEGYKPLLRDIGRTLHGILVVQRDSPILKVKDLAGKRVAFPAPNALGATLVPRADLKNIFGIGVEPVYVQSHSSVYLNVALGRIDAGGGVQKTFEQQPATVSDKLRIIYKTRAITSHPIAAHSRVPATVQESVRQAFLALGETSEGRALLSLVPIKTIGITNIDDYRPLGEWGLAEFDVKN